MAARTSPAESNPRGGEYGKTDASSSTAALPIVFPSEFVGVPSGFSEGLLSRLADYAELSKLRIATLVLATVTVGFALGSTDRLDVARLCWTLLGVTLAAAGSSAWNQAWEMETDGRMRRTRLRPLPSGRLSRREAVLFGLVCGVGGPALLAVAVNTPVALWTLLTVVLYSFLYTPLKRSTCLCTAVGAVPGALPPALGWIASRGEWTFEAFGLFAILFLWQFPHFLAIAWIYQDDYDRAGLRMVPRSRSGRSLSGLLAVAYSLVLIPVSLMPADQGVAGSGYFWAALVLGIGYFGMSFRFWRSETLSNARLLLWTSLIYLPTLLAILAWDHFRLLN